MNKKTNTIKIVMITTILLFVAANSTVGRPTGYQSTIDYVTPPHPHEPDYSNPIPPSILGNVLVKDISIGISIVNGPWVSVKIRNTFLADKTVNVKLFVGEFTSDDYGAEDHTLLNVDRQITINGLMSPLNHSSVIKEYVNLNTDLAWQPVVVIVIVTDANTGECYDGKMGFGIYFINLGMGMMYPTLFPLPSEDADDLGINIQVIDAPELNTIYTSIINKV